MVSKYRDAGLIEPWDTSRIPNFGEIAPRFLNSKIFSDDTGVWYIPTDYAYTAIAYNTTDVPAEDVASLDVFLNPKYAGRISLPDNTDDVWALALLATGVTDWTNISEEQFQAAATWLRQAHENVVAYWADPSELSQLMAGGQVQVAWSWNDSIALMREEGFPVGFQRQAKEGASSWFCGYVNFKDSPGSEDKAYDFINAWLDHGSTRGLLDGFEAHGLPLLLAQLDPVVRALVSENAADGIHHRTGGLVTARQQFALPGFCNKQSFHRLRLF